MDDTLVAASGDIAFEADMFPGERVTTAATVNGWQSMIPLFCLVQKCVGGEVWSCPCGMPPS